MIKRLNIKERVLTLRLILLVIIYGMTFFRADGQTADSIPKPSKDFRNSIKLNITSRILYKNAFQMSYERLIGKNQSLNIFGGYQEFPTDLKLNLQNTALGNSRKKSGYSFGADYRFYLSKENKYNPPRGVYLAPFFSFHHFSSDRTLTYTDSTGAQSSANLNTQMNFLSIGGVLGYQFVLGRRWVIDCVLFGPAMTNYKFKADLENNIPGLDEGEALQAVIDAIKERLPLLKDITSGGEVSSSGTEAFWSAGMRYSISVGFRF